VLLLLLRLLLRLAAVPCLNTWHLSCFQAQVVQNHGMLSFWGSGARVLVADLDEFIVPARAGDTLPRMAAPGGCLAERRAACTLLPRHSAFLAAARQREDQQQEQQRRAGGGGFLPVDEPALWQDTQGPNPLLRYHRMSSDNNIMPKALVDPGGVLPVSVHFAAICSGNHSMLSGGADGDSGKAGSPCSQRQRCTPAAEGCVRLLHVTNMLAGRLQPSKHTQPIEPRDWLWMLQGHAAALNTH
jgi:hypothetical protein